PRGAGEGGGHEGEHGREGELHRVDGLSPVRAHSAGAASGSQPPLPASTPTWARTRSRIVVPTPASRDRARVVTQATGVAAAPVSVARRHSRARLPPTSAPGWP